MGRTVARAMTYEKAGRRVSNRNVVEQGVFKDLTTVNMCMGVVRELYRRYAVEFWATAFWLSIALNIWRILGV